VIVHDHAETPSAITLKPASTIAEMRTEVPDGLGDSFAADAGKQRQWDAFSRNLSGPVPAFGIVVGELRRRLAAFLVLT
jgi:hypothetical protein